MWFEAIGYDFTQTINFRIIFQSHHPGIFFFTQFSIIKFSNILIKITASVLNYDIYLLRCYDMLKIG